MSEKRDSTEILMPRNPYFSNVPNVVRKQGLAAFRKFSQRPQRSFAQVKLP
jgi:hypothetical protein